MTTAIVCGTDLGPSGRRAADVAAALGKALDAGLFLVHTAADAPEIDPLMGAGALAAAEALAARLESRHGAAIRELDLERARLSASGVRVTSARVVEGRPWEIVAAEARSAGALLAVVGPHARPRSTLERFLGTTAEQLIRHSDCAVVIATGELGPGGLSGREIVVAVDGEPPSLAALRLAIELAARAGANVHAVCASNEPSISEAALSAARAVAADAGASISYSAGSGRPADAVLSTAAARGAALIAVGTHGRSGFSRAVLGSVAETVARGASVPVLVCHAT